MDNNYIDNSFESFSCLDISSEVIRDKTEKLSNENSNEYYPYICPKCYSIPKLDIDFQNNEYYMICDNNHKHLYDTYGCFKENTSKSLNYLLCHNCMNSSNEKTKLHRCNSCFLFFCDECKIKHKEISSHSNYIELNDINKSLNNEKFTPLFNDISEIEKEYINIMENHKIFENFKKDMLNIFNDIYSKIKNYFEVINNFFIVYKNIINFTKNNINIYKNNFNCCLNFELFFQNEIEVNEYLNKVYKNINSKELEYEKLLNFIKFVNCFEDENIISIDYIEKKRQILKNNNSNSYLDLFEKKLKINELTKMKIIIDSKKNNLILEQENKTDIKSFCSFNSNRYIIFGTKKGEIIIYEIPQSQLTSEKKETFVFKLSFRVFENEIKHICELDSELIAVSDGKYTIKIIKLEDDITKYSIVQTISQEPYDTELIYSMISLPKFSTRNKRHYFCTADDNHILIYKSNKKPKRRRNYKNKNDPEPLNFTLEKDIVLNTLTHCLIEANEKYLIAACSRESTVVFFDMNKNFEKVSEIENIHSTYGKNIFSLIPNKNILIVGCKDGFIFININKKKAIKKIQCRYNVLSLDLFDYTIICSCYDKNINKFKQYEIDEDSYDIKKVSERLVYNNDQIWKIQKINDRIFFINGQNIINYLA